MKRILNGVRRRWRFVVCASVALLVADIGIALSLSKIYRAEALLQVDERSTRATGGDGDMRGVAADLDAGGLSSQVDVIRAPDLAVQVIGAQHLLQTPEYLAAVRGSGVRRVITSAIESVSSSLASLVDHQGSDASSPAERLEDAEAVERRQRDTAISYFGKHLDVSYDQHGSSLRIAYRSANPVLAASVVNAVARIYTENQLHSKLELLVGAGQWLDQRLGVLRTNAEESENQLVKFRQDNDLGTEQAPGLVREQLIGLSTQLAAAISQEANANARLKAARNSSGQDIPEVLNSKVIENLRTEQSLASSRLINAKAAGNFTAIQRADAELKGIDGRLQAEVERVLGSLDAELQAATARRKAVQVSLSHLVEQVKSTDQAYTKAAILEREAVANRSIFDAVLKKAEETRTLNGLQRPDVRLVSPALVPGIPYGPKLGLIIVFGIIVSPFFSCLAAALLEIAYPRIHSVDQGELELGIPALGWMPNDPQLRQGRLGGNRMLSDSDALAEDCCRSIMLSTTVLAPQEGQVLLVTSAAPDEGKTTFALSYARTVSAAGRRCIVVNADLRRPFHDEAGQVGNLPGLADVISKNATVQASLRTDPTTGLAILDAGSRDGDPIGVFTSKRFPELVQELRRSYDTVVIDAPPLLAVSDGLLLARHADFTVVIIRWASTPTHAVAAALERLKATGADAMAFVLARVDPRQMRRSETERYSLDYARRTQEAAQW
jgi:polysaccharide biosynthesis transport protein